MRSNSVMHSIDNTSETPLCSLCGDCHRDSIAYCHWMQKACPGGIYRKCYDAVALQVHWKLYRKYWLECKDSGMTINPYQLQRIEKPENLRYDYFTDKRLKHNRPDITVVYKDTQEWTIIDIAVQAHWTKISTEPGE